MTGLRRIAKQSAICSSSKRTSSSIVDAEGHCTGPGWGGPPCPNAPGGHIAGKNLSDPGVHVADLPMLFGGMQPHPAGPLIVDPRSYTLLDFGNLMPVGADRGSHNNSSIGRDALDVALLHGGTQF